MKKTFLKVLAAGILLMFWVFPALAAPMNARTSGFCGDEGNNITWSLNASGVLTIEGSGAMPDYADPSQCPWYDYNMDISAIHVQNGVTDIGSHAFSSLWALETVELPKGLKSIGDHAFSECYSLWSVDVPAGTTRIGSGAFLQCYNLNTISLPDSLTFIGSSAFEECFSLLVTVSANSYAYNWCTANGVPCEANETPAQKPDFEYTLSNGTATIIRYNGDQTAVVIPASIDGYSVEGIGASAFANNMDILSVSITEGVSSIDEKAFSNCGALETVELPASLLSIADTAFENCYNLTAKVAAGSYAAEWCNLHGLPIDSGAVDQPPFIWIAADNAVTITGYTGDDLEVDVPALLDGYPVAAIGSGAFARGYDLTSIHLPESVVFIGENAFAQCYNLHSVNLPAGVTFIGEGAFVECYSLTVQVTAQSYAHIWCITNNVACTADDETSPVFTYVVSDGAATITRYNGDQNDVIVPAEANGYPVTAIGENAFADCHALASVALPESIVSIAQNAFARCYNLCTLNLPAQVSSIAATAFDECYNLTAEVTSGSYAHIWCRENGVSYHAPGDDTTGSEPSETTFALPASLQTIDAFAFVDIAAETVIVPNGCTFIGEGAFANNLSLKQIYMPDSVSHIEPTAFAGCQHVVFICESYNTAAAFAAENGYAWEIASK